LPPNRIVRAAAAQSLPAAQEVVDTLRAAYLALPAAKLVTGVTLNPVEILTVDGQTGQSYRVPVTIQASGAVSFHPSIRSLPDGTPGVSASAPALAAKRGLTISAADGNRIQAAVARGALTAARAEHYRVQAAAGHDISVIDHLAGGLVVPGMVAAAAAVSGDDADYAHMFGGGRARQADGDTPEYTAMFGSAEDIQAADRRQVTAMTDDELYRSMFKPPVSRAPVAPINASSAAGAGKPRRQEYVRHPSVSLRVPDVAASAGDGGTKWRSIKLHAGDPVPPDAHPEDLDQLRHQMNKHGAAIKDW
jgi:hypothetical protein